jgi:phosphoribosylformylglycinamidine synthase PurS subunit
LRFKARIEVKLKRSDLDPEAETVRRSLVDLNFPVTATKISKVYAVTIDAKTKKDAEITAKLMCSRLLANPSKDDYKFSIEDEVGEEEFGGSAVPDKSVS